MIVRLVIFNELMKSNIMLHLFKSIRILLYFLIFILTTTSVQNFFLSIQSDPVWNTARSLSLPKYPGAFYTHKCHREEPTSLHVDTRYQQIQGNGSNQYLISIEDCCEGYKRYEYDWKTCVPDCGVKCANGLCVSPGQCHCFPGFVKNDDGECVNTCPLGCLNGKCSFDGHCTCNHGYELDEYRKYCKPICKSACLQSLYLNCTAPGFCDCLKGYERIQGHCRPVCNPLCRRGSCIAPNQCNCANDSVFKNGICQSKCNLICQNGFCATSVHCQCDDGYKYDNHTTTCLPMCSNCFNGICIKPNICKCFKGYTSIEGKCEPHCPEGCHNGICMEPNKCECPQGTVDRVGFCRNSTEVRCTASENGRCTRWSSPLPWQT